MICHDLCRNPATIEQRTGRVDRIGSKVERERMRAEDSEGPTLEIAVPYLAATCDERMSEELHRPAQLFEGTLGGEMRVEGRIEPDHVGAEYRRRADPVEGGRPRANLNRAVSMVRRAASRGCRLAVLPECLDPGWTDPRRANGPADPRPARRAAGASTESTSPPGWSSGPATACTTPPC